MSVQVDMHQRLEADTIEVFDDADLPPGSGGSTATTWDPADRW